VHFRKLDVTPREMVAAVIVFALLGLLIYDYNRRYESERHVTYYPGDQPLIDRALDLWSVENNQPRDEILTYHFPVVVEFRNETCVALPIKAGAAIGGTPVYCFDPKSLKLTRVDLSHAG